MAENIASRMGTLPHKAGRRAAAHATLEATLEVQSPLFLSMFLIIAAYLPLLTLQRIEGLLFRPMALTMIFALVGALLLALFVVPAAISVLFADGYREWHNPLLERLGPKYERWIGWCVRRPGPVAFATAGFVVLTVIGIAPRLGTEFLPRMDEGVIWVRASFPEGMSLEQSAAFGRRLIALARGTGDIAFASMQAGRNDSGTDPFPPSRVELMVGPRPEHQWQHFDSKQEMIGAGIALPRRVPDDALQLHAAHHRQRHGGHQRHLGEPRHRAERRRSASAGRARAQDQGPARQHRGGARRQHRAGGPRNHRS